MSLLDKILTISAQDYVGPNNSVKELYEVRGVHCSVIVDGDKLVEKFAENIPDRTEVVVDYRAAGAGGKADYKPTYILSGTALIPRH